MREHLPSCGLLAAVLALSLAGCDGLLGGWPVRAELGEPFTLRVGQTAAVEGLRVTFLRVLQDSRCPVDVVCIWAGNARVELELAASSHGRTTVELNSSLAPREATFGSYLVRYVDLRPYPRSTERPDPPAYRLTLVVSSP
ncbi:MAG: hypothetical protein NUW06_00860 [Candidatus Acetothermia bacterium]|jgi:hypothetical protein|nr:hypothetical protein [Candidatus Acetothermia bacterium]MDH7505690.1 hypothetical protein [Candidatus Acetothermia bacterium]